MRAKPKLVDIMLNYKTKKCSYKHNTICRFAHDDSDIRRFHIDLASHTMNYWNILYIPNVIPTSQRSSFCQNIYEYNYHVVNYKTQECPYLEIAGVCQQGDYCHYIHPDDNLDEIVKFRSALNPPPISFNEFIDVTDNTISYPLHGLNKKIPKHIFILPDGEEAYNLGLCSN